MIYLDNNATTRLDDAAFDAMLPFLKEEYGNASSLQHKLGRQANQAIESARQLIADTLQVQSKEIFFTSGSTEVINTVLRGVFDRYQTKGSHIITCQTEHKAVLTTCRALERKGATVTYLPVDRNGTVSLEDLKSAITAHTILVCLMSANNETGILHPIKEIAELCREKEVIFFCDSTQSLGKQAFDLAALSIDICCFSAHKFHGPKGAGILFIRRKTKPIQIAPLHTGGDQEQGLRGGTYNVPAIVGMGEAIRLSHKKDFSTMENLRNHLEHRILTEIEDTLVNGKETDRTSNTSNITIKHVRASELMTKTPNIAIASGSACVSGARDPSHVLKAMGHTDEDAFCSIRISLSRYNTLAEIDHAVELLKSAIQSIRDQSPIWQMYKNGLLE
ncbi:MULTISPECIES: cysteine desulfurase family protein [Sphingobacterium]|uniref:cysteine desulfurase family protein n=1 Tax=Sphingobacterium TaxID=28453 RepID=UPI0013D8F5A3|nr:MULTISPECIES: cysteine desulfurase family protein [unclassified Sphingobacterium]